MKDSFQNLLKVWLEMQSPNYLKNSSQYFSDEEKNKIMKKIMEFLDSSLIADYTKKKQLEKFKNRFYDKNDLKKLFSKENIMKFLREDNLLDKSGKEDVFNDL